MVASKLPSSSSRLPSEEDSASGLFCFARDRAETGNHIQVGTVQRRVKQRLAREIERIESSPLTFLPATQSC